MSKVYDRVFTKVKQIKQDRETREAIHNSKCLRGVIETQLHLASDLLNIAFDNVEKKARG